MYDVGGMDPITLEMDDNEQCVAVSCIDNLVRTFDFETTKRMEGESMSCSSTNNLHGRKLMYSDINKLAEYPLLRPIKRFHLGRECGFVV